ncbi:tubulin-tyrosine ligase family-domain-containing protein, partial [Pelagophyceae sp. CCMP2097]
MRGRVVQKYVEDTLLHTDGRKFDLRIWCLVSADSENVQNFFVYEPCYARLCSRIYNLDEIEDPLSHLSNLAVQRRARHKDAVDDDDDLLLTQKALFEGVLPALVWRTSVLPRLEVILKSLAALISTHAAPRPRAFELVGVDVVLDSQCTPWLLEVNLSPALAKRSLEHTAIIDNMLEGVLDRTVDKWFADPEDSGWRLVCQQSLPPVAHNRLARLAIVGRGLGARLRLIDADISLGGAVKTLRPWCREAIWRRRVRCTR